MMLQYQHCLRTQSNGQNWWYLQKQLLDMCFQIAIYREFELQVLFAGFTEIRLDLRCLTRLDMLVVSTPLFGVR
jgi:hypothetical protein